MVADLKTHIAYRCPECASLIYGFVGRFALSANLLRLKCSCGHSVLDITVTNDNKIRLSVPCIFCKKNHSFVVSQNIFFGRDRFLLNCPYANMDICFIGEKDKIDADAENSAKQLEDLLKNLEAESVGDIQPTDMEEDEILPDPALYDAIRFLAKELEADGKIDCPCHSGKYDVRFYDKGIEIFCPECNATHKFNTASASACEDYVYSIDSLTLSSD